MPDIGFVWAYNARGEKRRVPAHWIGHPVIKGWRLTPSQRATAQTSTPRRRRARTPATGDNPKKEQ